MPIRTCTEADGWDGIAVALSACVHGDVVHVEGGTYAGSIPLTVPSGVRLRGTAATILEHHGTGPAIWLHEVSDVSVQDLTIHVKTEEIPTRALPDGMPDDLPPGQSESEVVMEWGILFASACERIDIERVSIRGEQQSVNGIAARRSWGIHVRTCNVSRLARNGVAYVSASGAVSGCTVDFVRNGIAAFFSRAPGSQASRVVIVGNRCCDSQDVGIVLFSSHSSAIEANQCRGNKGGGIVLVRDPAYPRAPSEARIHQNRCHDNEQSGIILLSSQSEAIEANECWGNKDSGIFLRRDPESADAPSPRALTRPPRRASTRTGATTTRDPGSLCSPRSPRRSR